MGSISNEDKLEAIKNWLRENKIEFKENFIMAKLKIDLWVPKLCIAIHIDDEDSGAFYKKTFRWCKPFFIRENETKEFVLEKIQNCAFDQMVFMQKKFEKENNKK